MRWLTILALLVAISAVFLGVGHTEETTTNDFEETAQKEELNNEGDLTDSFETPDEDDDENDDEKEDEDDDDAALVERENALEETASSDEDEPEKIKRMPWRRRRRRRRRRRFRIRVRIRGRRLIRKVCKYGKYFVRGLGWKCYLYHRFTGDEGSPEAEAKSAQNDESWLGEE